MSPLRRRLEQSKTLAYILSVLVAGYIRLCFATSRWTREGVDVLVDDLAKGPVMLVMWHENSMIAPMAWPRKHASIFSLRDPSPAGLLSSALQARFGVGSVKMAGDTTGFGAARDVISGLKAGRSLGLTADGPQGPARQAKAAPVDWARIAGRPIYVFSWSSPRAKLAKSWDQLKIPMPFMRGAFVYQRWQVDVPKRLTPDETTALRDELTRALNDANARAAHIANV